MSQCGSMIAKLNCTVCGQPHQESKKTVKEIFIDGESCELDGLGKILRMPRKADEIDSAYRNRLGILNRVRGIGFTLETYRMLRAV